MGAGSARPMRIMRVTLPSGDVVVVRDCDMSDTLESVLHAASAKAGYGGDSIDWEIFNAPRRTTIEQATAMALKRMKRNG
jgi:hypothetical protein